MEKFRDALNMVKHPEIDCSLVELGMIGEIRKEEERIIVELKLPMLGIPIQGMLAEMIKREQPDSVVDVEVSQMTDPEKMNFFNLAKANWAI